MSVPKEIDLDEWIKNALHEVNDRTEKYLTQRRYAELRDEDHPTVSNICHVASGWNAEKEKAGLEVDPRATRKPITEESAVAAIQTVSDRTDYEGTFRVITYNEHRDDDHPSGQAMARKFGWTHLKDKAGLERNEYSVPITEETALRAMKIVDNRCTGDMTIKQYEKHRDEWHPNGPGISQKLGWKKMKRKGGLYVRI